LTASRSAAGLAQYQAQVAAGEHGKRRGRVHDFLKAEVRAIERDRGVDIMDNVSA
jgi:hypothetical protein